MTKKLPPLTNEYRRELQNAAFSIVFFALIYCTVMVLALGLVAAICLLVLWIFTNFNPGFITVLIGGGLAGMAILIILFLFKFIFSSNEDQTEHFIQIRREQEPELFTLIDEVVNEVGTMQPKKVFLSSHVNASVTYNSSFWSMFLPVKKNLTIGLGLVNSTTVSELKSVLAHEFGHFSQRSMKVGSFVNQSHRIIHDMLYNNDSIDKIVEKLASLHAVLYLFARLAILVIEGIRWVLGKTFDYLVIRHMSLSKQMEFNADAIATYVVGSETNINTLLRLDLSETAFQKAVNFYLNSDSSSDTKNLFKNQTVLLQYLSEENNHELKHGLPYINESEIERYNKSKLVIEDQWSSHPTIQQRIREIKELDIPSQNEDNRLAANILKNFTYYAETFTNKIFQLASLKRTTNYISSSQFLEKYQALVRESTFPKIFNNYYDYKSPVVKEIEKIVSDNAQIIVNSGFFSDEMTSLVYEKTALENDVQILDMIQKGTYKLKTFDYDGKRYTKHQADRAKNIAQERLAYLNDRIEQNDRQIFRYCYYNSPEDQKEKYFELQHEFNKTDEEFDLFQKALENFLPFVQFMGENHPVDSIPKLRSKLLENEKIFKVHVEKLFSSSFGSYMTDNQKELMQDYVKSSNLYFNMGAYLNQDVQMLSEVLNTYPQILTHGYFKVKKNFLDFKSEIIGAA